MSERTRWTHELLRREDEAFWRSLRERTRQIQAERRARREKEEAPDGD